MKDIIMFLVLLVLCILVDEVPTKTVFSEIENQDVVRTYYLEIEGLNTNNFDEYVNDLEVVSIMPYINPIYDEKIMKIFMYEDINKFKKNYINNLKQKGFYKEANKYMLRPIIIKKISVNASLNEIYEVLKNRIYKIIDK